MDFRKMEICKQTWEASLRPAQAGWQALSHFEGIIMRAPTLWCRLLVKVARGEGGGTVRVGVAQPVSWLL